MQKRFAFRAAAAALPVSALVAAAALSGCLESGTGGKSVDFDRKALLENLADRLIVPAYARLAAEAGELDAAVAALVESPDSGKVADARVALKEAWLAWQWASMYELGPAMDRVFRQRVNTFPVDTAKVEANISSGTWKLDAASNLAAQGFPALDWLLNRGEPGSVAAALEDTVTGDARGRYLREAAGWIADNSAAVHAAWTGGSEPFRDVFVSRLGTDIGSSLGELVNQFNYDFEILKTAKIGIPLGKRTSNIARPTKVEGYYGGYSMELARAQAEALEGLFLGRDSLGADRQGFDDYLVALGTRYQDGELAQAIKDRFTAIRAALEDVPDPLSRSIGGEAGKVETAYDLLVRTVVLIKTDMPSAMSVMITYQDGDGD